ncbi:MAG: addiction module protein [Variibacter sp.]|nr:addiction module protein [Variibacter sp.]
MMNKAALLAEILRLPEEERRDLLAEAWESLPEGEFLLTPEQSTELDRRMAEHERDPSSAVSAEQVIAELQKRFG